MKFDIKSFVLGIIVCICIGSSIVYAGNMLMANDVYFSQFPIKVNGKTYTADMPVLNYQGRTYLALREFGTVTGNDIDFVNNTIIINNSSNDNINNTENIQDNQSIKVYRTKTGKKYHYNSNCNGGTYYETSLNEATKSGLTPCSKCVK